MGAGPAVVLVHGYPLDGAMWSGVARRASPASSRVKKPDLPGRGETIAAASGSIREYADFVEAILKELPPPAGLAGFSMGGYVVLSVVERRPESLRAIALVDTRASADDEAGPGEARTPRLLTPAIGRRRSVAEAMLPQLHPRSSLAQRDQPGRSGAANRCSGSRPRPSRPTCHAMRDRPDSTPLLSRIAVTALKNRCWATGDALTPPSGLQGDGRLASAGARLGPDARRRPPVIPRPWSDPEPSARPCRFFAAAPDARRAEAA